MTLFLSIYLGKIRNLNNECECVEVMLVLFFSKTVVCDMDSTITYSDQIVIYWYNIVFLISLIPKNHEFFQYGYMKSKSQFFKYQILVIYRTIKFYTEYRISGDIS